MRRPTHAIREMPSVTFNRIRSAEALDLLDDAEEIGLDSLRGSDQRETVNARNDLLNMQLMLLKQGKHAAHNAKLGRNVVFYGCR